MNTLHILAWHQRIWIHQRGLAPQLLLWKLNGQLPKKMVDARYKVMQSTEMMAKVAPPGQKLMSLWTPTSEIILSYSQWLSLHSQLPLLARSSCSKSLLLMKWVYSHLQLQAMSLQVFPSHLYQVLLWSLRAVLRFQCSTTP